MKSFLSRFQALVFFVLSGFDRLRFCGESRLLNHAGGVNSYLYQHNILRKHFPDHCEKLTGILRKQTNLLAEREGVPVVHLNSPAIDKEAAALELARKHQRTSGRIALLTCQESGLTFRLRKNSQGFFEPRKESIRCSHLYHYFLHQRFGLCYVRIQSWFPFTVRVGLNGRLWLARELQQRGVPFQQQRNLITSVDDPDLAQRLLDEQTHADWPALLQELVEPIHPLWNFLHHEVRTPYYWMTEQSEWASDIVFRTPDALRAENTFNHVAGFKVFRTKEGEDDGAPKSWQKMRKGVADLGRRAEIGQSINNRLLESLSTVAETTPLGKLLEPLGQPVVKDDRRIARVKIRRTRF